MDLLNSIRTKFIENYSKTIAELNKNVYIAAKLDNGNYEAPAVTVTKGGGTIVKSADQKLDDPATVKVEMQQMAPLELVYRLAIPRSELEITEKNPPYFKYFFDKVLTVALSNYKATIGGPEKLRFGSHYIKAEIIPINDGSDFFELRLSASFANEKEVIDV